MLSLSSSIPSSRFSMQLHNGQSSSFYFKNYLHDHKNQHSIFSMSNNSYTLGNKQFGSMIQRIHNTTPGCNTCGKRMM